MADYVLEKKSDLTAIADAIREKSGLTEGITVANMAGLISALETGGGGENSLNVITGTFSVASDVKDYTLTDSRLDGKTVLLITYYCPELDATPQNTCVIGGWVCGSNVYGMTLYNLTYNTGNGNTTKTYATGALHNKTTGIYLGSSNRKFLAGYTYQWTAYAV
jgi:hypothetical protein